MRSRGRPGPLVLLGEADALIRGVPCARDTVDLGRAHVATVDPVGGNNATTANVEAQSANPATVTRMAENTTPEYHTEYALTANFIRSTFDVQIRP